MKWNKYAEKGVGIVVVHGDLTSVILFEALFDISVSYTKTPRRKYPLETHVEMGSEFAVEEKCMKWTKFAEKGVEPANAYGTFKFLVGSGPLFKEHRSEMRWNVYAEKGVGTVVVHKGLASVALFEALFNISVSKTQKPTRKSPSESR
ncbi:hypothetical protein TWF225_004965 [Orbilia oligospora]|nr:hypothetical protein TWF751_011114 [Orbilia oligospora]KAF3185995.1 hypothetical protein TWF225_004965 [Orbilia oligospora]KAF3264956.1 hypothetical protein TWF217_002612 [Orbilia oligospora]KAF3268260.1 hypothetical protein TWF128_008257 [Orbilia oligospora]KAF3295895.1 hypothetical protein TWF132_000443 [Orbilia oligospora]